MSQSKQKHESVELDMEMMCNIQTSEDSNISFYEGPSTRTSDESCSGSITAKEKSLKHSLLKRNVEVSLDSGYTTEVSRSPLHHGSFSFSGFDMEEFVNLDVLTTPAEVRKPPTDFENLLLTPNFSTPNINKTSLKRSLNDDLDTIEQEENNILQRFKKFKTPDDEARRTGFQEKNQTIYSVLEQPVFDLIGDFSKVFTLPIILGKHPDLKCITPQTLMHLIQGQFKDAIPAYRIIDCRYPYEYNGGHVDGATNLYYKDQLLTELLDDDKLRMKPTGEILIFHCEFSSERAPGLCRALRNLDRNGNTYPNLHYPEMYILDGGYKNFFNSYPEFCVPKFYVPMRHPSFQKEYCEIKSNLRNNSMDFERRCSVKRLHF